MERLYSPVTFYVRVVKSQHKACKLCANTQSKRIRFDKSCKKVSDMSHLTALFINYRTKIGRKSSEICYELDKADLNKQ